MRTVMTSSGRRVSVGGLAVGLLWLGCLLALAPRGMAADDSALVEAPRALVEKTIGEVLAILKEPDLSSPERRRKIEAIAFEVFDFRTMSKLVLARNWKRFSKDQREEFVEQFKRHLSRNYGSRLERYERTDVAITGTRIEPRNDVTVRSHAVGGRFDGIEMDYRMRQKKGTWLAIDVVIEGVSLVANFRSQFVEIISNGGPEELLRQMKGKNFDSDLDSKEGGAS